MIDRWFRDDLRLQIERRCATTGVPIGVAAGWVDRESGGRLSELTTRDERGLFQLDPAESKDLGLTPEQHKLLSTNLEWSLDVGFRLVLMHHRIVARYAPAMDERSELAWRLTKFSHSIGAGAAARAMRDAGRANPTMLHDWPEFSLFCQLHQAQYSAPADEGGLGHDPLKWISLVNDVFSVGMPYGVDGYAMQCGPR